MLIILSLLLALVIRLFMYNFYVVPSDSMTPAIIPGDFIITNKLTYGARIFTNLKFDRNSDPPIFRMPGFRAIRRNDVIVFNFPYRNNHDTIRMNLEMIFIKRCIGLPGDSISAIDGLYNISGLADTPGYIPQQELLMQNRYILDSVILIAAAFDKSLKWNIVNFGPLYIPAAGQTIALTPKNVKLYRKQIVYETNSFNLSDSLNSFYTFRTNWYFVAGDNVMNSQDSRYIGLIPEDYIIGRASRTLSSKDIATGKRRWNRTLKRIK